MNCVAKLCRGKIERLPVFSFSLVARNNEKHDTIRLVGKTNL